MPHLKTLLAFWWCPASNTVSQTPSVHSFKTEVVYTTNVYYQSCILYAAVIDDQLKKKKRFNIDQNINRRPVQFLLPIN